jgi:hypothetical protein
MSCEDIDLSPIVEELQHHRPMFPANGWRVIHGAINRKGKYVIKELFVMGLVWNSDPDVEGCIDFIVWDGCEPVCLSSIKDNMACTNYTWPVAPTESFNEKIKDVRCFLEGEKEFDMKHLKELNEAALTKNPITDGETPSTGA